MERLISGSAGSASIFPAERPPAAPSIAPSSSGGGRGAANASSKLPWNVPMAILSVLICNHFARPFEFVLTGYRIPLVICVIGIFTVVMSGALKAFLSAAGKPLIALVIWMAVSTAFSTWRGGSAIYLLYFCGLQLVLFLLAAAAPRSFGDVRRVAFFVLGSSTLYIFIGSSSTSDQRFDLRGTFGNADDVALLAGFVLPFVVLFAQRLRNPVAKAFVLLIGCAWLVRVIGSTGTRAGLLAIIALLLVYLLYASALQRVALLAASVVGMLAMLVVLPSAVIDRFASTFSSFGSETVVQQLAANDEAMASVAERRVLLQDAITMTMRNPVFGVGPGEFPDYRYQFLDPTAPGGHKRYFPSHNTYLQVSSEEGIPGLLLYLGFFAATFFSLRRSLKLNRADPSPTGTLGVQISICLQAALVYFMVCAAFMTCERHPQQYVVAGLAIALERISRVKAPAKSGAAPAPSIPQPLWLQQQTVRQPVPAKTSVAASREPAPAKASVAPGRSALARRRQ
jgi:putative inorganic carbon (HCO3(-)) transporter